MDDSKNCVLVAKREYTIMLNQHLYPGIYQGLKSIWDDARKTAAPRRVYEDFQNRLARVKKWNQDVIDNEYRRIVDKSRCEWLDDLIKQVFVINTQILASVNMHTVDPNKKIKVKVPKGDKFIHFCYKECARAFYEEAPLMEDRSGVVSRVDQIKNRQKAYKLITTCIENTVRNMLPIESLLKGTMQPDDEGEDATPNPMMFPSMRPPPLSESPFSRRNSVADLIPQLPSSYDGSEKKQFDPETLFAPAREQKDRDHDSDTDKEHQREKEREREREHATIDSDENRDRDRERDREQERERERERDRDRERDREREREREAEAASSRPEGDIKTIYIGPNKGRSIDRELRTEDSDEVGKSAFAGGGPSGSPNEIVADITTAEIPMLGHRTPYEKMDLDVNTDRNELHIVPKKSDDTGTGSVETVKEPVPSIEHFDTAHFFSDVE